MALFKKSTICTLISSLILSLFLFAVPAQATVICSGLTELTDPLAIRMENGETVIWDNVKSEMIQVRNTYVSLLKQKGWTIQYTSAYRPYQYQNHLYEIVQKASTSSCIQREKNKHGLGSLVAVPSYTAPHTAGIAFDAIVKDENGQALNGMTFVSSRLVAVANQAGLSLPHPTSDGVHHQYVGDTGGSGGGTLKLGSKGEEVRQLQTQLNRVGYNLTADGDFGSATDSAVRNFQSAHGLTADGIVGTTTWTKLNSLASTTVILKVGSQGDEVKVLQRLLSKKGYSASVDGVFGSGTASSVKSFQTAKGLSADGIVGPSTWKALRQ